MFLKQRRNDPHQNAILTGEIFQWKYLCCLLIVAGQLVRRVLSEFLELVSAMLSLSHLGSLFAEPLSLDICVAAMSKWLLLNSCVVAFKTGILNLDFGRE